MISTGWDRGKGLFSRISATFPDKRKKLIAGSFHLVFVDGRFADSLEPDIFLSSCGCGAILDASAQSRRSTEGLFFWS